MAVCTIPLCGGPLYQVGLCKAHKARLDRTGDVSADVPIRRRSSRPTHCQEAGCTRRVAGGGLCASHYAKRFNEGWRANRPADPCQVDGCESVVRSRGYCSSHYSKMRRWGSAEPAPRPKPEGRKREKRSGYVLVRAPESPMAMANGYVPEHRLVMAEQIGRPLRDFENVHHINGVRDDNRPENLELWNTYQPAGQRPADKVAWALEILALYAPDSLA